MPATAHATRVAGRQWAVDQNSLNCCCCCLRPLPPPAAAAACCLACRATASLSAQPPPCLPLLFRRAPQRLTACVPAVMQQPFVSVVYVCLLSAGQHLLYLLFNGTMSWWAALLMGWEGRGGGTCELGMPRRCRCCCCRCRHHRHRCRHRHAREGKPPASQSAAEPPCPRRLCHAQVCVAAARSREHIHRHHGKPEERPSVGGRCACMCLSSSLEPTRRLSTRSRQPAQAALCLSTVGRWLCSAAPWLHSASLAPRAAVPTGMSPNPPACPALPCLPACLQSSATSLQTPPRKA